MKICCPSCGVRGTAADTYRGKKVKCPKCREIFIATEVTAGPVETDETKTAEPSAVAATGGQGTEPPAAETREEREKETIPDWQQIAAEIEAQAVGDRPRAGAMAELPDGLFTETTGARPASSEKEETLEPPAPPQQSAPVPPPGAGTGDRQFYRAEPAETGAGTEIGEEQPFADAADEGRHLPRFTIGDVLREAWKKTAGAKGPILAGGAVMYIAILFLGAAAGFLLPIFGHDLTAPATGIAAKSINFLFKALLNIVYALFAAGFAFMGIRRAAGDPISWRLIFAGFADAGKIIVATILKFVLIFIGFLILVLPGIYLAIGYSMTIPLIVDRKMSPWQAMETSRKAIHRIWWRVFGLYLVTGLLLLVSIVPFGIGLIWTMPLFVILTGVIYRHLFGAGK